MMVGAIEVPQEGREGVSEKHTEQCNSRPIFASQRYAA
jgi:hypothetical protein